MSEYQYYDFRAIDKPLNADQRAAVASLSSRAEVSSRQAVFVYNYGDFRGDVDELMADAFDMMLYVANWGSRQLMIRLPANLVDTAALRDYFISDELDLEKYGAFVILNLNFSEEENYDWIEGDGLLDELLPLREELLQGDYRGLYLAWLKAAEKAVNYEEIDENTFEPRVPAGLHQLTAAQRALADFIGLDEALIRAGAATSPALSADDFQPEAWLDQLPAAEKEDFLLRLCRGETNLQAELLRRLKTLYPAEQTTEDHAEPERRTVQSLLTLADELKEVVQREAQEAAAREAARRQQERLAYTRQREALIWQQIERNLQITSGKAYENTVDLLLDLREVAKADDKMAEFHKKSQPVLDQAQRKPALMRRLQAGGLV